MTIYGTMSDSIVVEWLRYLDLQQYAQSFLDNGYDDLEICKLIEDRDLDAIGVDDLSHRKQLLRAIKSLREQGATSVYLLVGENGGHDTPSINTPPQSPRFTHDLDILTTNSPADVYSPLPCDHRSEGPVSHSASEAIEIEFPRLQLAHLLRCKLISDKVDLESFTLNEEAGNEAVSRLARRYAAELNTRYTDVRDRLLELIQLSHRFFKPHVQTYEGTSGAPPLPNSPAPNYSIIPDNRSSAASNSNRSEGSRRSNRRTFCGLFKRGGRRRSARDQDGASSSNVTEMRAHCVHCREMHTDGRCPSDSRLKDEWNARRNTQFQTEPNSTRQDWNPYGLGPPPENYSSQQPSQMNYNAPQYYGGYVPDHYRPIRPTHMQPNMSAPMPAMEPGLHLQSQPDFPRTFAAMHYQQQQPRPAYEGRDGVRQYQQRYLPQAGPSGLAPAGTVPPSANWHAGAQTGYYDPQSVELVHSIDNMRLNQQVESKFQAFAASPDVVPKTDPTPHVLNKADISRSRPPRHGSLGYGDYGSLPLSGRGVVRRTSAVQSRPLAPASSHPSLYTADHDRNRNRLLSEPERLVSGVRSTAAPATSPNRSQQHAPYPSAAPPQYHSQHSQYQPPSQPLHIPLTSQHHTAAAPQYTAQHILSTHAQNTSQHGHGSSQPAPSTSHHNPMAAQHNQMTSQHNQMMSQHNQMTSQQNQMTSQHNQMASQHNQMTPQHNPITSQHNQMSQQHFSSPPAKSQRSHSGASMTNAAFIRAKPRQSLPDRHQTRDHLGSTASGTSRNSAEDVRHYSAKVKDSAPGVLLNASNSSERPSSISSGASSSSHPARTSPSVLPQSSGIPVAGSLASPSNSQPPEPRLRQALAITDYTPNAGDHDALTLRKGDFIDVMSCGESGVWRGALDGRVGTFPSLHVELVPDCSTRPRTRSRHDLESVLARIGLKDLTSHFVSRGISSVESFAALTEDDFERLQIGDKYTRAQLTTASRLLAADLPAEDHIEGSKKDSSCSNTTSPSRSRCTEDWEVAAITQSAFSPQPKRSNRLELRREETETDA